MDIRTLLLDNINIIASIGTFLASIVSVFTLIQVSKQREDSIRPYIVIDNMEEIYIYCEWDKRNKNYKSVSWGTNKNSELIDKNNIVINLENIGDGTAKNIKIDWKFNDYFMSKYIYNETNKEKGIFFSKEKRKLYFKDKDKKFFSLEEDKIEYIPTINSAKGKYCIVFYDMYMHCISNWVALKIKDNKCEIEQILKEAKKLPELKMTVSYQSISGKMYMRRYKFEVEFKSISYDEIVIKLKCTANDDSVEMSTAHYNEALIKDK